MGKRYAELELKFNFADKERCLEAITSRYGSLYVFDFDKAKKEYGELLGKKVKVKIGGVSYPMYFTREFNWKGRFYNLKFGTLDEYQLERLNVLVNDNSLEEVPWRRRYPRLDTITHQEKILAPSVAVIHFASAMEVYRVLNFTLDSCLVEASNPNFESMELGASAVFDLCINNGEELNQINARLMRISLEKFPDMDHKLLSLGIKIVHMQPQDLEKYRSMIRMYCEALKNTGS